MPLPIRETLRRHSETHWKACGLEECQREGHNTIIRNACQLAEANWKFLLQLHFAGSSTSTTSVRQISLDGDGDIPVDDLAVRGRSRL